MTAAMEAKKKLFSFFHWWARRSRLMRTEDFFLLLRAHTFDYDMKERWWKFRALFLPSLLLMPFVGPFSISTIFVRFHALRPSIPMIVDRRRPFAFFYSVCAQYQTKYFINNVCWRVSIYFFLFLFVSTLFTRWARPCQCRLGRRRNALVEKFSSMSAALMNVRFSLCGTKETSN